MARDSSVLVAYMMMVASVPGQTRQRYIFSCRVVVVVAALRDWLLKDPRCRSPLFYAAPASPSLQDLVFLYYGSFCSSTRGTPQS